VRHLTLDVAKKLLSIQQTQKRLPKPFPGDAPTRVAWHIEVAPKIVVRKQYVINGENLPEVTFKKHSEGRHEVLNYVGKPSVYRSLEAANFFREPPGEVHVYWAVEFDRAGPLALVVTHPGKNPVTACVNAYWAFHPQSASGQVWDAYTRRFFLKRIGRLPTYSYQQKLSQEKIDAFYAWYEKVFERKLKRPKQKPMILGTGVADEADE
jgi:hypothetical protein